jgi:hypothetical protein
LVAKGSDLAGEKRIHLGGWAGLVFGEHWIVGGGGFALLEAVELGTSGSGSGFDLGMGYGGIQVRYRRSFLPSLAVETGALLGAGHAEVKEQIQGLEIGSDNFYVVEPEVSALYTIVPQIYLELAAGYRVVWGVEDLPRVSAQDLRAATASLSLRLGGG